MNSIDTQTRVDGVVSQAEGGAKLNIASVGARTSVIAIALGGALTASLAATVAHADDSTLAEVVVTAQRRTENLQDVPISISVFTAKQLSDFRIEQASDLASYTPGLVVSTTDNGDPVFSLRGVGMNNSDSNQNQAVTEYINEVAVPSIAMLGFQMFDLERVEVLKGPQGDLYGRNTTGGAINFITARPTQDFTASTEVNYGNFNLTEIDTEVGGGVTDTLALRFAGHSTERDGWQTVVSSNNLGGYNESPNGDIDRQAARLSALWKPADNFQLLFVGDATFDNSQVLAYQTLGYNNSNGSCGVPLAPGLNGKAGCPVYAYNPSNGQQTAIADTSNNPSVGFGQFSYGNRNNQHLYGGSVTMDWTLTDMTLTSVTGARKLDAIFGGANGSPYLDDDTQVARKINTFSEEVRLAGNATGPLTWLVGAYYGRDRISDASLYNFADSIYIDGIYSEEVYQKTQTEAVFAHTEYQLADQWKFIAGIRETHEEKDFVYNSGVANPPVGNVPNLSSTNPTPIPYYQSSIDSNGLSGKIGLNYNPSKDVMLYADVSEGFKGGGFPGDIQFELGSNQAVNNAQLAPYASEKLYAYEVGFKSTLADSRLQLNSAVYYYDWRNFQASTETSSYFVSGQSIEIVTEGNAGNARIYGLDSDGVLKITDEWSLRAGLNLMHAKIVNGTYLDDTPVQAPKVSTNLIASYQSTHAINNMLPFAQVDYDYRTAYYLTLPNVAVDSQGGYGLLGLRAGVKMADSKWEWSAWGRNLTNKWYLADAFGGGGGAESILPDRHVYADPRTFGVSVRYTF